MKITTLAEILACKPNKYGWRTLPDGNGVKIGDSVEIGDGAKIGTDVEIGNYVEIGNGVEINQTPTYIQGSRFFMSQVTTDGLTIQSGCLTKPLSWWRENIRRCAERHKYTPEQVEEYAAYIDLFTRLAELR